MLLDGGGGGGGKRLFVEKMQKKKKINNKWVEGTPNPDLLEDFLPVPVVPC